MYFQVLLNTVIINIRILPFLSYSGDAANYTETYDEGSKSNKSSVKKLKRDPTDQMDSDLQLGCDLNDDYPVKTMNPKISTVTNRRRVSKSGKSGIQKKKVQKKK